MKTTLYIFAQPAQAAPSGYNIIVDQHGYYNYPLLGSFEIDLTDHLPPEDQIIQALHEYLDNQKVSIQAETEKDLQKIGEQKAALLCLSYDKGDNDSTTGEPPTGGTMEASKMNAEVLRGTDIEYIIPDEPDF